MFSDIETESDSSHAGLIMDVADAFMSLGHFESALKYYHMLESNAGIENVRKTLIFFFIYFYLQVSASHKMHIFFSLFVGDFSSIK